MDDWSRGDFLTCRGIFRVSSIVPSPSLRSPRLAGSPKTPLNSILVPHPFEMDWRVL